MVSNMSLYFRMFQVPLFRPVFVILHQLKMFVETHARLMGTLSS